MEGSRPIVERKPRPEKDQALNCPRCNSTNTKFCYYNNYSLSQPRYFCKSCRRYWTNGGSLRSVPVGGGSRKNRRPSSSSSSSSSTKDLPSQNPKIHHGQDLNLAYPPPHPLFTSVPYSINERGHQNPVTDPSTSSFMELLKPGTGSRELDSFMSMPLPNPSTELFSTLSFASEGFGSGYGNTTCPTIGQGLQESSGARVLFPLEEEKPQGVDANRRGASLGGFVSGALPTPSTSTSHDQGFWNGMFGGVGSW